MDADRAQGQRRWGAGLVDGIMKLSSWHGQPVLCYGIMVVSFLVFQAQGFITRFITSEDICSSESFMEKMIRVLPKLSTDCDLVATTLASHPNADIAIILDIWIFIVFLFSIIFGVLYFVLILMKYREPSYRRYSRWMKLLILVLYMIVIPGTATMVLFYPVLVVSGTRWWGATLASHGFGAALQTLIAMLPYGVLSEYYHNRLIKWREKS